MFRLNTFGRLFVERDGVRLTGAASQPRRLALLALLAGAGERGITRDRLLVMLWAESDEDRARRGLNQALYALRQELGADEIFLGTQDLRLNPELITSDLAGFLQALAAGRLEQAVAEYAGPFLDGFHLADAPEFERWLEEQRGGLARDYATVLERLARRAHDAEDWPRAAEWWRRLAAQDPLNAKVAVELMRALVAVGDRAGALKHARVYEALLQQELDAPPDRAVVELARQLRQEPLPETPVPVGPPATPLAAAAAVAGAPEAEPAPGRLPEPVAPARNGTRAVRAAALVALLAAAGLVSLRSVATPVTLIGRTLRLTADVGLEIHPAVSPDGRLLAFAAGPLGRTRIYVRQLAGGRTIAAAEDVGGDQHWPRWSPDGTRLGFAAGGAIWVVPALGGQARALVPASSSRSVLEVGAGYPAWSPDGRRIAYALESMVEIRPVGAGPTVRIPTGEQPHSCAWAPDGSRLACALGNAAYVYSPFALGNLAPSSIVLVPAGGGPIRPITDASSLNTSPVWTPDGRALLFVSDRHGSRDIYRVGVDRSGPTGAPVRVTVGLGVHTMDLSRDGRVLVYATYTDYANIWALPIPGSGGAAEAPRPVTSGHQSIEGLALAPGGRWLAFDSDRGGRQAIYRVAVDGGEPEPLSADEGDDFMPSWSPDAREIAYYGFRRGLRQLFVMPADGGTGGAVAPDSSNQRFPDWSPDGRHLVFHSDRSGRFELYVVARGTDGRWDAPRQLTTEGGRDARWSPSGTAIVYLRADGLWLTSPSGGPSRLLVDAGEPPIGPTPLLAQWAPDGRTIYYKALESDGRVSFWSVSPDGGEPRLLVRPDENLRPSSRAEFATDGKRLYFTSSERESDVWQAELTAR